MSVARAHREIKSEALACLRLLLGKLLALSCRRRAAAPVAAAAALTGDQELREKEGHSVRGNKEGRK